MNGPAGAGVAVDRACHGETVLTEIGRGVLQRHGTVLAGSALGAAVTRNSLSTKLPLSARPGPCAGRFGSVSASSRIAVMPVRSVGAVIV